MVEIDKLEAGPELDALVAEKVMGCQPRRIDYHGREQIICPCPITSEYRHPHGGFKYDEPDDELLRYSTDIAAAWEVVEKCVPYVKVDARGLSTEAGHFRWVCQIWNGSSKEILGLAQTAPLAICRAALKAVGA